jgi:DNA-directed RNA polymerase specialized sigma24 family protein
MYDPAAAHATVLRGGRYATTPGLQAHPPPSSRRPPQRRAGPAAPACRGRRCGTPASAGRPAWGGSLEPAVAVVGPAHGLGRQRRLLAGHPACRRLVGRLVRDAGDREEVCQDVLPRFTGLAPVSPGREAVHLDRAHRVPGVAEHLERKRLPLFEDLPDTEQTRLAPVSNTPDPLENTVAGDARDPVRRAVDGLPLEYRTAMTLYYLEEMSVEPGRGGAAPRHRAAGPAAAPRRTRPLLAMPTPTAAE